jgi:YD repeat-containing protein
MKFLLATCLFTIVACNAFPQPPHDAIDQNEILRQNKIKKLSKYKVNLNQGKVIDSALQESCFYQYQNGHFLTQQFFDERDQFKFRYILKYNEQNQLILITAEREPATGAASFLEDVTVYQFEYDSLGREIRVYDYNKDTTRLKIDSKFYDKQGRLISIKTKINNDKEFVSRKYFYNAIGKLEKEDAFLDRKGSGYSYIHIYDKPSGKESIVFENSSEKRLEEEIFFNDKKQKIRRVRTVRNPSNPTKPHYNVTEYLYLPNGLLYERKSGITVERFYYSN